jgi:hypothetical protein
LHPRGDMFAAFSINAPYIELADGQCATILDHAADSLGKISLRRADQVQFELDRQDRTAFGEEEEMSVTACAVGDGRCSGGMEVAMLLREFLAERETSSRYMMVEAFVQIDKEEIDPILSIATKAA